MMPIHLRSTSFLANTHSACGQVNICQGFGYGELPLLSATAGDRFVTDKGRWNFKLYFLILGENVGFILVQVKILNREYAIGRKVLTKLKAEFAFLTETFFFFT
jgi:hypothetical protein